MIDKELDKLKRATVYAALTQKFDEDATYVSKKQGWLDLNQSDSYTVKKAGFCDNFAGEKYKV